MALILCPECGKEISDASGRCIHCGYPLRKRSLSPRPLVLLVLVVLAVLVCSVVCGQLYAGRHKPVLSLPYGLDASMTPKQLNEKMQAEGFVPDFQTAEGSRIQFFYQPREVYGQETFLTLLSTGDGCTEVAHLYREAAEYGTGKMSSLFLRLRELLVEAHGLPTYEESGECTWEEGPCAVCLYYVGEEGGNLWLDFVMQP